MVHAVAPELGTNDDNLVATRRSTAMTAPLSQYIRWFHLGAGTLRAILRERGVEDRLPGQEDWYVCPQCLDAMFTVEELDTRDLSIEHVPPESLGGRAMVLTCRRCNNHAGSKFDAEAHKQHSLRQYLTGESGRAERVTLNIGGIITRADMHLTGQSGIFLTGIPEINNPVDLDRADEYLESVARSGEQPAFDVSIRRTYSAEQARISWIRTAYLCAFAWFGWRYILTQNLQPIRDALAGRDGSQLPPISVHTPDGDEQRRELWIVEEPAEHQSLLFMWGKEGVFLPLPGTGESLADLARRLGGQEAERFDFNFKGKVGPWPTSPEHRLDPPPVSA